MRAGAVPKEPADHVSKLEMVTLLRKQPFWDFRVSCHTCAAAPTQLLTVTLR